MSRGPFTLADGVVFVVCELIAVPLCHAGFDAIVNDEHLLRGIAAVAVGLPIGIVGAGYHWWKDRLQWLGNAAIYWWPIAVILAFVYLAGPSIYKRSRPEVPPTVTPSGYTQAQLDKAVTDATTPLRRRISELEGAARLPPSPPPPPVYLADAGLIEAEPLLKFPATGKALMLTGRINEDINGKVAVYVDYGRERVPLGEISGTKNEKRELPVIEIVNLENDPTLRAFYWGDATNKRSFPVEPTPVQLLAICIVLRGDKGDQQVPIDLLRIKMPYNGLDMLRLWAGFESPCKRPS
jgi:hypothetical protein